VNSGDITATATGFPTASPPPRTAPTARLTVRIAARSKVGILSFAYAANSPTTVTNTGTVESTYIGIFAAAGTAAKP
jgi:hypothetical protein